MVLSGTHNATLVGISILIAVIASYTALDLAGRVRAAANGARRLWLSTAALAMGGGIWAMHFVAMLAFTIPGMAAAYDLSLTLLSLVIAILATGVGFAMMSSRPQTSGGVLAAAGLVMASGVVAMHYVGMAAMRMSADLRYDRAWLTASVLISVGASTAALWLAARRSGHLERVAAALLMGGAVAGMHFAGMQAAVFTPSSMNASAKDVPGLSQTVIAAGVSVAAFSILILILALAAAMFDRRLAAMAEREAEGLRRNEERFRALYNGTPLPLQSLDSAGCIEHVSYAWLDLLGYEQHEVIGRPFVDFLTGVSAERFIQGDWPALLSLGMIESTEYRAASKGGAILDLLLSARVERDSEGAFVQVLGGLTDVTERKRTEVALRQSQKVEAIGQLTGGVAHDFNNLLAVIIGNLDLLSKRVANDSKNARFLESAMEGAKRGAALTQRLLAFARKQNLEPERVDVPELVRGMTDMLQRSLGALVKVETRFPLGLPPVHVDANQLELAILNLSVNARDAMPEGGSLEIAAVEDLVEVGDDLAAGRYVRLAITDSGAGMDETTLARATESFFTSKGVGKGTGLGLSMVQGFAAQSGGRLRLRSEPGRGTVAEIWIPVTAAVPDKLTRASAGERLVTHAPSRSILVVDDDPLVLSNTVSLLEDLGHRVTAVGSGREALDELGHGKAFDLLITDQVMPTMTGVQLAAAINLTGRQFPILLVSGYAEMAPDEVGSLPLLRKPFDQAALAAAVSDVLADSNVISLRLRQA